MEYHQTKADLRVVSALANLNIIPRREQALNRLTNHYELSLVYELEPVRTETFVDLALDCTYVEWREDDIALLKMYASRLVGSEAVQPELRAEKYEIALHTFLDWLLPEEIANALEQAS